MSHPAGACRFPNSLQFDKPNNGRSRWNAHLWSSHTHSRSRYPQLTQLYYVTDLGQSFYLVREYESCVARLCIDSFNQAPGSNEVPLLRDEYVLNTPVPEKRPWDSVVGRVLRVVREG